MIFNNGSDTTVGFLWVYSDQTDSRINTDLTNLTGCKLDRKSTTGGCHLLGGKLLSWTSKKQNFVSTSTAEAEYVVAGS
ncbi:hypothetical protein OSB04_019805 [Centaurea solstitialis]|uniref:Uncharacterized protein n=1 Tax=Centaurea solstitialis TaxID=347529 RepID=A0AA38W5C5_9ASTR|nr:hypothetical protein OSB04_019805 [Centaurea solstitialis]